MDDLRLLLAVLAVLQEGGLRRGAMVLPTHHMLAMLAMLAGDNDGALKLLDTLLCVVRFCRV